MNLYYLDLLEKLLKVSSLRFWEKLLEHNLLLFSLLLQKIK